MQFEPRNYQYHPYTNTPNHYVRSHQGQDYQVIDAVLGGIKREARSVEIYRRLAGTAPNQIHKQNILHALEGKKALLSQFENLYVQLTGNQPVYKINKIPFQGYNEGLEKAYEAELDSFDYYQRSLMLTRHPHVQELLGRAITAEQEAAARFQFLTEDGLDRQMDYGSEPFVTDIEEVTKQNDSFRRALWTGNHLQVTLMSIDVGEDIGLEVHPTLDQFLRIEEGQGIVQMGDSRDHLYFQAQVFDDYAIVVPAGKWHNLTNTGNKPLKLYSIYAPPQHPFGTVHETKAIAMEAEEDHHH
ncbi:cupin domain-containing protein [Halalkalibacter akibai]|uniref:Mannose-6-phosphate isomerase n=1 Tax=Halalkalibacter akibai (strain ATCC 43226 / DSM 21942 / CIP 109018 / JCM 9157 / 1139) TaxID=1236973 RepID=W4QXE3_HALA3|nr:cupin domain-containing protein [Halalkalibacter akibai]GAE35979.1 mannose-6-phosphate isomerase [Halalkalibacter akibai JCM 9157]